MLEEALAYARAGLSVLPLLPGSKAPYSKLVPNGHLMATTDPATIEGWFRRAPDAGVGISLEASGLVAVDIDPRNGGEVADLPFKAGAAPLQKTGGGGYHIIFRMPGGVSLPGRLAIGIDLKYKGYIVAAPTRHPETGRPYVWIRSPIEYPAPPAPPALLKLAKRTVEVMRAQVREGGVIPEGSRNERLLQIAGAMRRVGSPREAITQALLATNATQCDPPLDEEEVARIALSVERYPVGPVAVPAPAPPPGALSAEPPSDADGAPAGAQDPRLLYLDDTGNAARLVRMHGDVYRYVREYKDWYVWAGTRWEPDTGMTIIEAATEASEHFADWGKTLPDEAARKALSKFAERSRSMASLDAAAKRARSFVVASTQDFDRLAQHFNCANGTVVLQESGPRFEPHNRLHYLTQVAPVAYDPRASCEQFQEFLDRILPDSQVQGYVQRLMGYMLIADTAEQILPLFVGSGANGKSVLVDTIAAVMGDYAKGIRPDALLMDNRSSIPADIAGLKGVRMAVAQEPDLGAHLAEGIVKAMTGDQTIAARKLYSDWIQIEVTWRVVLSTNHLPRIQGTDQGIWRRVKVVPFHAFIPPEERIPNLHRRLSSGEGSGILNWMIEGLYDYYESGLREPGIVQAGTEEYRTDMDPLGLFLEERVEKKIERRLPAKVAYAAYREWMAEGGYGHPMSMTAFGLALGERGYEKTKSHGTITYLGIALSGTDYAAPF